MPPKKSRSSITSSFQPSAKRSTSNPGPTSAKGKASVTSSSPQKGKALSSTVDSPKASAEEAAREAARRAALAQFKDADPLRVEDRRFDGYWRVASKKMGNPVHAQGLNRIHHMLRVFDMDPTFGPCMGLTRLERWHRAKDDFEEDPPEAVRIILETQHGRALDEYRLPVYANAFAGWGL
ncbi:unnamed protein product [Tilletia controversa]|uniref:DNA polymerase delta subunit 4 n=1 Tax=Tilletia controversa TaxID=13291 RepID=A0A8X7MMX9_9BASI|nr:hypothetical protein CF328_g6427 [Tilletia controversa]KAE8242068.1 hypothetical protein A4X06_0g7269 [Tilletia controversa]CAD6907396.1 unnamed protein product [Tilletia controversa]CAD6954271.1 unnamed protein product [Tilletia controversa]CAD6959064.1 unnamed protein product [Tilletia controversa]